MRAEGYEEYPTEDDSAIAISSLMLANSGLALGDDSMINTLADSELEVYEAETVTLIYDSKGKSTKDSFFEAYAKEVLGGSI